MVRTKKGIWSHTTVHVRRSRCRSAKVGLGFVVVPGLVFLADLIYLIVFEGRKISLKHIDVLVHYKVRRRKFTLQPERMMGTIRLRGGTTRTRTVALGIPDRVGRRAARPPLLVTSRILLSFSPSVYKSYHWTRVRYGMIDAAPCTLHRRGCNRPGPAAVREINEDSVSKVRTTVCGRSSASSSSNPTTSHTTPTVFAALARKRQVSLQVHTAGPS
jgi:hypothetical protein